MRLSVNITLPGGAYVKAGQELPDGFEVPEHLQFAVVAEGESEPESTRELEVEAPFPRPPKRGPFKKSF